MSANQNEVDKAALADSVRVPLVLGGQNFRCLAAFRHVLIRGLKLRFSSLPLLFELQFFCGDGPLICFSLGFSSYRGIPAEYVCLTGFLCRSGIHYLIVCMISTLVETDS